MPFALLKAYLAMLTRLQAEEALGAAQVEFLPYYKSDKQGRSRERDRLLKQWQNQALGKMRPQTDRYDEYGRLKLNTANDLRAWFNTQFAAQGVAGSVAPV